MIKRKSLCVAREFFFSASQMPSRDKTSSNDLFIENKLYWTFIVPHLWMFVEILPRNQLSDGEWEDKCFSVYPHFILNKQRTKIYLNICYLFRLQQKLPFNLFYSKKDTKLQIYFHRTPRLSVDLSIMQTLSGSIGDFK